jgi:hypothetical protein
MRSLLKCAGVLSLALVASLGVPSLATAQIPNPGFETWGATGPDGWVASFYPGIAAPVSASNTRHGGLLAARGEVLSALGGILPPFMFSIFPQAEVPQRLQLYYQFAPQGGDVLNVGLVIYQGNMSVPVAVADTEIVAPAGVFTLLDLPMQAVLPGTPDTCYLFITVNNNVASDVTVGTTFIIDDLAFSNSPTSVSGDGNVPAVFALDQNYPNPFNPSTTIGYSLPEAAQVRLEMFNAIGERVATLVDSRQEAGSYRSRFNASALPSGVYLYRLTAGSNVLVKRMMLVK